MLMPYATFPEESKGRLHKEPESPGRSAFQRDRDRIIHATAFRRLEYKTQVFVYHEGDHYRNRLTHSLEVAQLARSTARVLKLEEDLAEATALAHDLGHPPFGHAGEDALDACMKAHGGFDHNAQSLAILTHLEQKYAAFNGLNLSWEALEGIVKHNGPLLPSAQPLPKTITDYNRQHDLALNGWPGLEAQLAALCDDIAYNNHDIEDGLRAGLLRFEDVLALPLVGETYRSVMQSYPDIPQGRLIYEARRRIIHAMISDMVATTSMLLSDHAPHHAEEVRNHGQALVQFSEKMTGHLENIRQYLRREMYRHYKVNRMTSKARRIVTDLFQLFVSEPECLPKEWNVAYHHREDMASRAVVIANYLAGMTDRFAIEEHRRLFDTSYRLIGQ